MSDNDVPLKREITWYGSFCMGYANVSAGIYVALGLVALYAAGASPFAFAIAAMTYICTSLAYTELATVYPYAGGAQIYAIRASRDLLAFIVGWAVMFDYTVCISFFSLATAGYLSFFIPALRGAYLDLFGIHIPYLGFIAFAITVCLILVNLIGMKESSKLNEVLVSLNLVILALIIVIGAVFAFSLTLFLGQVLVFGAPQPIASVAYISSTNLQAQNFIYGMTIAMSSFIGVETIAQAAEETKKPHKWIPLANKLSVIAVLIFTMGLSLISLGILPWGVLGGAVESPVAVIVSHIPIFGPALAPVAAATGLAICLVAANTGIIGASRVTYSMSRFKLLPDWFHKTHARFKTPYRTILVFSLIGGALSLIGELGVIAEMYNFGAILSYLIVNISLVILRNKEQDVYRAWKAPGDIKIRVRSKTVTIPLVGVIGAVLCAIMWSSILLFHPNGRMLGSIWLVIGVIGFAVYRIKNRLGLLTTGVGGKVLPSGFKMNATVFLSYRTPEDVESVADSISAGLDPRFVLRLLTVLDPEVWGLTPHSVKSYRELEKSKDAALEDLNSIAKILEKKGFECTVSVEIGNLRNIVRREAKMIGNDVIAVLKRRRSKREIVDGTDVIFEVMARFPGKLTVLKRRETYA